MPFDVEGARQEGYSDDEIADYLAQKARYNINGARQEGYSSREIIDHLNPKPGFFQGTVGATEEAFGRAASTILRGGVAPLVRAAEAQEGPATTEGLAEADIGGPTAPPPPPSPQTDQLAQGIAIGSGRRQPGEHISDAIDRIAEETKQHWQQPQGQAGLGAKITAGALSAGTGFFTALPAGVEMARDIIQRGGTWQDAARVGITEAAFNTAMLMISPTLGSAAAATRAGLGPIASRAVGGAAGAGLGIAQAEVQPRVEAALMPKGEQFQDITPQAPGAEDLTSSAVLAGALAAHGAGHERAATQQKMAEEAKAAGEAPPPAPGAPAGNAPVDEVRAALGDKPAAAGPPPPAEPPPPPLAPEKSARQEELERMRATAQSPEAQSHLNKAIAKEQAAEELRRMAADTTDRATAADMLNKANKLSPPEEPGRLAEAAEEHGEMTPEEEADLQAELTAHRPGDINYLATHELKPEHAGDVILVREALEANPGATMAAHEAHPEHGPAYMDQIRRIIDASSEREPVQRGAGAEPGPGEAVAEPAVRGGAEEAHPVGAEADALRNQPGAGQPVAAERPETGPAFQPARPDRGTAPAAKAGRPVRTGTDPHLVAQGPNPDSARNPRIIDNEALQRENFAAIGKRDPNSLAKATAGLIAPEHANMLQASIDREARESFDKDGNFLGPKYTVSAGRGIRYHFNDLAEAREFAATHGMRAGKRRQLTEGPAGEGLMAEAEQRPSKEIAEGALDRAVSRALNRIGKVEVDEPKRVQLMSGLGRLIDNLARDGDHEAFRSGVEKLFSDLSDAQADRRLKIRSRVRGDLIIRQRVLEAVRRGDIAPETADLVEWLVKKNPDLVKDLGISVRGERPGETPGARGFYDPLRRIFALIAGKANAYTAAHEIMHHFERFLPSDVQDAIRKRWSDDIARRLTRTDLPPEHRAFLEKALEAEVSQDASAAKEAAKMYSTGDIPADFYKYLNPSEYWAVNAGRLMEARYEAGQGGVWSRAKQWIGEFMERAKDVLGMESKAPVIRAIDDLLSGKRTDFSERPTREKTLAYLPGELSEMGPMAGPDWVGANRIEAKAGRTEEHELPEPTKSDFATLRTLPDKLKQNVDVMSQYENFKGLKGRVDPKAEAIIEHMKRNIVWLHDKYAALGDKMGHDLIARARQWYDGAHNISQRWATKFEITYRQSSGMLAAMSPGMDWHNNVSTAERIATALHDHYDHPWTKQMDANVKAFMERDRLAREKRGDVGVSDRNKQLYKQVKGKTLRELHGNDMAQAMWIRAFDEAYNDRAYRVVTPEGNFGDFAKNKDGSRSRVSFSNGLGPIAKAISIYHDGSRANISREIGMDHKVRNFYHNIVMPHSADFATIDTHATGAAIMQPLGQSDKEVANTFGGQGSAEHAGTGLHGTYPMLHEAYTRAAAEISQRGGRPVLPREMQSITWEAVKGLFRPEQKRAGLKDAVKQIWRDVSKGKLDEDAAREKIHDLAGGISPPAWMGHDPEVHGSERDSSYEGQLHQLPGAQREGPTGGIGAGPKLASVEPVEPREARRQLGTSPEAIRADHEQTFDAHVRVAKQVLDSLGLSWLHRNTDYEIWHDAPRESFARATYANGRFKIRVSPEALSQTHSEIAHTFLHEHGHVLDLGGKTYSSTPDWEVAKGAGGTMEYRGRIANEIARAVARVPELKALFDYPLNPEYRTGEKPLDANGVRAELFAQAFGGYNSSLKEVMRRETPETFRFIEEAMAHGSQHGAVPPAERGSVSAAVDRFRRTFTGGRYSEGGGVQPRLEGGAIRGAGAEGAGRAGMGPGAGRLAERPGAGENVPERAAAARRGPGFAEAERIPGDEESLRQGIARTRAPTPEDINRVEDVLARRFSPDQVQQMRDAASSGNLASLPKDQRDVMEYLQQRGFGEKLLRNVGGGYVPFEGIEKPAGEPPSAKRFGDSIRRIVAPASRGPLASEQAGIMRHNLGAQARADELAVDDLWRAANEMNKMSPEERLDFTDRAERGRGQKDSKLDVIARQLREAYDKKANEVRNLGTGALDNFIENYMGHAWKDPDEASHDLFTRRPLAGRAGFAKRRTIPLTKDGMRWRAYDEDDNFVNSFDTEDEAQEAAGKLGGRVGRPLEPVTTNPVEMALVKLREMDRYIYGQKIFQEMKDRGIARFVRDGERAPKGWTELDDKIANVRQRNAPEAGGGMIQRGSYYAPDEAATLFNSHLTPGLQGNTAFQMWRYAGNMLNQMQLGLSAFHVGFTTFDAMVSRVSLGNKQISRGIGKVVGGQEGGLSDVGKGLRNIAVGSNILWQPAMNFVKGDKLLKAYLGDMKDPEMVEMAAALEEAGGRVRQPSFYSNEAIKSFKSALADRNVVGMGKHAFSALNEIINKPIFDYLVPRQKLGVFFDMAKDWSEQNPDADLATRRRELGKLWDSVDNRMGQLVYDNVFWDRSLKDGLMASVRSVGWNLGTFRELGGGVADFKQIGKNKALTDRSSYLIALPFLTAVYGAITQYLYTQEGPEDWKDLFFPRTGRTRPDGSPDRVNLPTYMKDIFAYYKDAHDWAKYGANPLNTLSNKVHPLVNMVSEMLSGKDFYGAATRNPADPWYTQVKDTAMAIGKHMMPFSVRNYFQQESMKQGGGEPGMAGYLASPSNIGVTPAPGYMTQTPEQQESAMVARMRQPLIAKFKEEIQGGADPQQMIPRMRAAGLNPNDIRYVLRSGSGMRRPTPQRSFGQAP